MASKIAIKVPNGHFSQTGLRTALRIAAQTLKLYIKCKNFPAPAGRYRSANKKVYPYYNLEQVKDWIRNNAEIILRESNNVTETDSGWEAPHQSLSERKKCIEFREVYKLMKGERHV